MEEAVGGEEDLTERAKRLDAEVLGGRRGSREGGLWRGFLGSGLHLHRLDLQGSVRDGLDRLQFGEVVNLFGEQTVEVSEFLAGRRTS